jgi:hypothetical protein
MKTPVAEVEASASRSNWRKDPGGLADRARGAGLLFVLTRPNTSVSWFRPETHRTRPTKCTEYLTPCLLCFTLDDVSNL